jgi:hypothetical protein
MKPESGVTTWATADNWADAVDNNSDEQTNSSEHILEK